MNSENIKKAAELLADARRQGKGREPLPAELQPSNIDEGHAIQDATVALLNETVGGWKVGLDKSGAMSRAPIFTGVMHDNNSKVDSRTVPLLGVEAEIAFRFRKNLPARDTDYSREEIADAVEAFPAIELLNSRYAEPGSRSQLEKLADCIIQGGIVCGTARPDWKTIDFSQLNVVLTVDGKEIANRTGSHPTGDPVLPMVALVNELRTKKGVRAGQIMTTGTWTGVNYVTPSSVVVVAFKGFEPVTVRFTP